jgi:hypothetical protein
LPPARPASHSTAEPPARAGSALGHRRRGADRPQHRPDLRSCGPTARSLRAFRSGADAMRSLAATAACAIESASACSRLSSSTIAATSSVMLESSLTRAGSVSRPARLAPASAILMLTSLSEQSTPGRIVDEVGVDPPAVEREFDAPGLRGAKVSTFADHLAAPNQRPSIAQAVIGRIAHRNVVFGATFHIGADAAEPQQVHFWLQDRGDQAIGIDRLGFDAQRFAPDFLAQRISLALRGNTPPPFEISFLS